MSKVKKYTKKDELDRYFNETLSYTELYLKDTENSELVEIILKWLDKLSRLTNHRYLRNQYLSELLKQLKSGNISDIFCKPPPRADLSSLPSQCHLVIYYKNKNDRNKITVNNISNNNLKLNFYFSVYFYLFFLVDKKGFTGNKKF